MNKSLTLEQCRQFLFEMPETSAMTLGPWYGLYHVKRRPLTYPLF